MAADAACRKEHAQFVIRWLRDHFEVRDSGSMAKASLFELYADLCEKESIDATTSPAFGKLVRKAFPNIKSNRKGPRGRAKHHYFGLHPKNSPHNVVAPDIDRTSARRKLLAPIPARNLPQPNTVTLSPVTSPQRKGSPTNTSPNTCNTSPTTTATTGTTTASTNCVPLLPSLYPFQSSGPVPFSAPRPSFSTPSSSSGDLDSYHLAAAAASSSSSRSAFAPPPVPSGRSGRPLGRLPSISESPTLPPPIPSQGSPNFSEVRSFLHHRAPFFHPLHRSRSIGASSPCEYFLMPSAEHLNHGASQDWPRRVSPFDWPGASASHESPMLGDESASWSSIPSYSNSGLDSQSALALDSGAAYGSSPFSPLFQPSSLPYYPLAGSTSCGSGMHAGSCSMERVPVAFRSNVPINIQPHTAESPKLKIKLERWIEELRGYYERILYKVLMPSRSLDCMGPAVMEETHKFWFMSVRQAKFLFKRDYLLDQVLRTEERLLAEIGDRISCDQVDAQLIANKLSNVALYLPTWLAVADGLFPQQTFVERRKEAIATFAGTCVRRAKWYQSLGQSHRNEHLDQEASVKVASSTRGDSPPESSVKPCYRRRGPSDA